MIAFDTNLLVRFLADDDKAQADIAEALMRTNSLKPVTEIWYIDKKITKT